MHKWPQFDVSKETPLEILEMNIQNQGHSATSNKNSKTMPTDTTYPNQM